jgi:hypothetical protein
MKTRNTLEVKGALAAGALALAFWTLPAPAAEPDGHAFVRDSIRNTWKPTAVASQTEGKIDAHEQARTTLVGTMSPRSPDRAATVANGARVGAHEQARRLLLAQPVVTTERTRSGS